MAGGGGCDLAGACCDASVSDKNEGDSFNHKAGGQHTPVPLLAVCLLKCSIVPQIYYGGGWIDMAKSSITTTPITTNITPASANASRPCVKNVTFSLTCQPGSGGSTWQCRYKATAGVYTYYCYFNVQVNALPAEVPLYYQMCTP